ncbi:MAG: Immunoglobulin I-set domain protein, partial [Pedosphaera sp.]|nr:Immunoglobulin I-set domain protein [Pedosphaera sp.]
STLTVIPTPTGTYPVTVLHDHPVAYYRLDEAVGSPSGYDYVGGNDGQYVTKNANQLPLLGVPGYNTNFDPDTACKFGIGGTAAAPSVDNYLGGSITNISFAKPNGQSGAFSLEAWVNGPAGVSQIGGACIVAKGQGGAEQFSMDANNGFRFYVRNAASATLVNAQGSSSFCGTPNAGGWQMDGKWHHLVGVCDQVNSNLLLYVDGQLIGPNVITNGVVPKLVYALDLGVASSGTNGVIATGAGINETTITINNENSVVIGNRNKNSGHVEPTGAYRLPFIGTIDEVALYDYPLTPAQVFGHYAVAQGLPIPLTLQMTNGSPVLTWTTASVLQSATSVNGPWATVVGATSPYTITTVGTQQFYRLKVH